MGGSEGKVWGNERMWGEVCGRGGKFFGEWGNDVSEVRKDVGRVREVWGDVGKCLGGVGKCVGMWRRCGKCVRVGRGEKWGGGGGKMLGEV